MGEMGRMRLAVPNANPLRQYTCHCRISFRVDGAALGFDEAHERL